MEHKNLDAWKLSIDLVNDIYEITKNFPNEEKFGLVSQMRRCAVSIPSNIAEGASRQHDKEMIQFLYTSLSSLSELETQLIIAKNQNYYESDNIILKALKTRGPIVGLIRYLKNK